MPRPRIPQVRPSLGDREAEAAAQTVRDNWITEGPSSREFTREQARAHRDRALAALDAAGTIEREPRARLEEIIDSVISA